MKSIVISVAALVACVVVAGAVVHQRWIHPRIIAPASEVTFRDTAGAARVIPASAPPVVSVISWITDHQTGWQFSFASYAPHDVISCDTFHVNLGDHSLVLNYARQRGHAYVEVTRTLSDEEDRFWRDIITRIKRT